MIGFVFNELKSMYISSSFKIFSIHSRTSCWFFSNRCCLFCGKFFMKIFYSNWHTTLGECLHKRNILIFFGRHQETQRRIFRIGHLSHKRLVGPKKKKSKYSKKKACKCCQHFHSWHHDFTNRKWRKFFDWFLLHRFRELWSCKFWRSK